MLCSTCKNAIPHNEWIECLKMEQLSRISFVEYAENKIKYCDLFRDKNEVEKNYDRTTGFRRAD